MKSKSAKDPLMVQSVERAFRVLEAFDAGHPALSLTQLAAAIDLDKSAAQRFTHTLTRLGYLVKDPDTKRFALSARALDLGARFTQSSPLVGRAMPYLLHLSKMTEETVNLTVLDGTSIVFVSRFMSRHVLNTDTVIGGRMPAYCTASGIAIMSRMERDRVAAILDASDLRPHTPHTCWKRPELLRKIELSGSRGYATAFEEYFYGDLSIAAPVLGADGLAAGAINVAVSTARYSSQEVEEKFAPLVVATALSISVPTGGISHIRT